MTPKNRINLYFIPHKAPASAGAFFLPPVLLAQSLPGAWLLCAGWFGWAGMGLRHPYPSILSIPSIKSIPPLSKLHTAVVYLLIQPRVEMVRVNLLYRQAAVIRVVLHRQRIHPGMQQVRYPRIA